MIPLWYFLKDFFRQLQCRRLRTRVFLQPLTPALRATDGNDLPASEYQLPATSIYADFPLFLRRYPKDKSHFVQDIALGRPILIVEHPSVFRNGYKAITDVVDWVNNLGNIKWTSLLSITEYYFGAKTVPQAEIGQINPPSPSPLSFRTKVALRRFLSEIRDNYIETSSLLTKAYKMVRG